MFAYLIKYSIIFDTRLIYLISLHWINRKGIALGFIDLYWLCAIVGIMQIYGARKVNEFMSIAVFCLKAFWSGHWKKTKITESCSLKCKLHSKISNRKNIFSQKFWIQKASETFVYVAFRSCLRDVVNWKACLTKREYRESCAPLSLPQIPLNQLTCLDGNMRHDSIRLKIKWEEEKGSDIEGDASDGVNLNFWINMIYYLNVINNISHSLCTRWVIPEKISSLDVNHSSF